MTFLRQALGRSLATSNFKAHYTAAAATTFQVTI
jgi:hypothetical protein